ncbi:MAG: 4-hydroxy-tetrahydrodipicolinate synthase [Chloroflexi bacterium]|nr:4-hydroxy-tetrahydrodipicolinate synthase [Chloroflexota bacterium]MQC16665.1 4-hydroxy-tetrahydrodipicolinate synthase [Chloroflexota bacterium]
MTTPFGRLITAMVTPMTADGEIDLGAAQSLARALVATGTESIVATGSTGEAPALTEEETVAIWRATKEAVGPNVAVIAGATNNDTRRSIRLTEAAEREGMDGVLLTVPAYNKPPQEGLVQHFTAIAHSTGLPCLLYNVPSRTSLNMSVSTTLRLAEIPNIVGVKEASGELNQIGAIIDVAPEHFKVWSGNDSDTLTVMALGGYGVVSVASHLIGFQIRAMMDAILDGRLPEAARMHHRMQTLVDVLFIESNPIPVKHAVNHAGLSVGPTRLPLIPASANAAALIEAELDRHVIDLQGALSEVA